MKVERAKEPRRSRAETIEFALHVPEATAEQLGLVREGFVSVAEAANFLGLAKSTVYALMEQGSLPYAKFNRARRIPRSALLNFAASSVRGAS